MFTPDYAQIVTSSEDKTIRVWDRETGEQLRTITGHTDMVYSVSVSPDGRQIRSASADGTLRIWDFSSGHQLGMISFPTPIYSATFAPDGRTLVVVREDGTARLLDSETYEEILTYRGHLFNVFSASFSPDGQYLVTSSRDLTARLWNPTTGEELRVLEGHASDVALAIFSPDGRYIATGSWDNTVRIWDTDYRQMAAFACSVVGRSLTPEERATYQIPADEVICDPQSTFQATPQRPLPVWTPIPTATPDIAPLLPEDYVYVPLGHEITLDGNLEEWDEVNWVTVTKGMPTADGSPPEGSFRFAVSASEGLLNIAMTVPDDNIVSGRHGTDYWNEDSFQFYLNLSDNLMSRTNIPGVSEFIVNATNIDRPWADPYSVVAYDSSRFQPQVITFPTEDGWGFEATVAFLDDFRPTPDAVIGFQAQYNSSDFHDRDRKFIWSSLDNTDDSWHNPSLYGRIVFTAPE
jgi:hypothetical protein